jgi:hypothetical protein
MISFVPGTRTPSSVGVECYQYQAAVVFPNNLAIETSDLIAAPLQGQHISPALPSFRIILSVPRSLRSLALQNKN